MGFGAVHPLDPVDFWEGLHPAMPAHLKQSRRENIRLEMGGVNRPSHHPLPRSLRDFAQRQPFTGGHQPPGFFGEFAGCGFFWVFTALHPAFDNRPRASVLALPQGAARVGDKDLKINAEAIRNKSCADHLG